MNICILLVSTLLTFLSVMVFFSFFGEKGLYAFIALSVVVANILVTQTINLFGIVITHGNAMYATGYLATDILSECYSKKEAKKAVFLGFISSLFVLIIMALTLALNVEESPQEDALRVLFTPFLRITVGSLVAYLVSNLHDVSAFEFWKNKYKKSLAVRNLFSTLISQLIDTFIFCTIAFLGAYSTNVFISILVSTYVLKFVLTLAAHPFFRVAAKKIYPLVIASQTQP